MLCYGFALFLSIWIVDKNTFQKCNIQHNIIVGIGTAQVFCSELCVQI